MNGLPMCILSIVEPIVSVTIITSENIYSYPFLPKSFNSLLKAKPLPSFSKNCPGLISVIPSIYAEEKIKSGSFVNETLCTESYSSQF
jgi:hypothetical protein